MNVVTQISGHIHPGNVAVRGLKSTLTSIGIRVIHPSRDESLFYETDSHAIWNHYDNEIAFYHSIAESPFHIIYNDGQIDNEVGLQITYAMLKERPILMTGTPKLADNLNPFLHKTITKHIHSIHSINLSELELTELSILLGKLQPINYSLSKSEKVLIKAGIRMHFRNLLKEGEQVRLERSRSSIHPIQES